MARIRGESFSASHWSCVTIVCGLLMKRYTRVTLLGMVATQEEDEEDEITENPIVKPSASTSKGSGKSSKGSGKSAAAASDTVGLWRWLGSKRAQDVQAMVYS